MYGSFSYSSLEYGGRHSHRLRNLSAAVDDSLLLDDLQRVLTVGYNLLYDIEFVIDDSRARGPVPLLINFSDDHVTSSKFANDVMMSGRFMNDKITDVGFTEGTIVSGRFVNDKVTANILFVNGRLKK